MVVLWAASQLEQKDAVCQIYSLATKTTAIAENTAPPKWVVLILSLEFIVIWFSDVSFGTHLQSRKEQDNVI